MARNPGVTPSTCPSGIHSIADCLEGGCGDIGDAFLNLAKNRTDIPAPADVQELSIAELAGISEPASVKMKKENNGSIRWLGQYAPLPTNVGYMKPLRAEEPRLRAVIRKDFPNREPELDLALNTGMRFEGQYNLRWVNVDLKRGQITLPSTKSGESQHIPINSKARKALARLRAIAPTSEFVCPDRKEHRKWWDATRTEAKIARYRWHDNRHTFASRLVQAGVPILTVNKLMRHATLQMTMRYAHLAPKNLHDAVEVLARSVPKSVTSPLEAAAPTIAAIAQTVN